MYPVAVNQKVTKMWWWWRWFNERTVQLRTLPLVPSPTGPHPARGDSGDCMCLPCVVRISNGLYSATSLASLPIVTHCLDMEKYTHEVVKFLPHRESNSGRQISGPVLYQLRYSVLEKKMTKVLPGSFYSPTPGFKWELFIGIQSVSMENRLVCPWDR